MVDAIEVMKTDMIEDQLDMVAGGNQAGDDEPQRKKQMVHIQFQQRTTRKCITIIQGLAEDLDFKKLVRHFKKMWNCNGTVITHAKWGEVIQLQGDNRKAVAKFLMEEGIASKEEIKIHGF